MGSSRANRVADKAPWRHRGDGLLDSFHFVAAEIVQDDDVSGLQCGAQELFDPGQEQFPIYGPVDHHGSSQLMMAQTGNEGGSLPIAEGAPIDASTALGGTAIATRHVGRGPGFINKYQLFDVHRGLRFTPCQPRCLYVLAILLADVQRFF